jgi:hypothetical protein
VQVFHAQPRASGAAAGGGAVAAGGAAAAKPKQFMAVKTAATPHRVDPALVEQHRQRYLAAGMKPHHATAHALKHHGIALYEGDGRGHFRRIPTS